MALPAETPAWAGVFVDLIHPFSLICAIVFPLIRTAVLKARRLPIGTGAMIEGVSTGFTFPSFIAMAFSSLPSLSTLIRPHLEGHTFALAGAMGVIYTLAALFKTEREEHNHSRFS